MYVCKNLIIMCDYCGEGSKPIIWADGNPPRTDFSSVEFESNILGWTLDEEGYNKCPKCSGCKDPTKVCLENHQYTLSEIKQLKQNTGSQKC